MGNKYIGLNLHTWHTKWSVKVHQAIQGLAEHIRRNGVKRHLILYGGDVEMFRGPQFSHPARFPQDYADIQSHILDMLRHEGLNCGTGMEAANGDYGQWKGKLDSAMHIMGTYRAEAEQYMHTVLQKAEESVTDMGDKDSDEWELISAASEDAYSAAPEDESDSGLASQAAASARAGQSATLAANAASGHAVEEVPIGSHWSEDEKFAARGLSIKSFAFQIPDLWSFVACLERFVDVYTNRQYVIGEEAAPLETVMSRVAVVLRIIRGAAGILWATKKLESSLLKDITSAEPTHKVLHTVGGRLLAEWKQLVAHCAESLVQDISSWELVNRWRMPPQYLLINGLILWFPG